MRARSFLALAAAALCAGGCTAFVASQLSGDQGSPAKQVVGDCFDLPNNQCGACIAQSCENPDDPTKPVSLKAVCAFDQSSQIKFWADECANDPTVGYPDNCSSIFQDGGTYAPSISAQSAAENNVKLCIRDQCMPSCRICAPDVPYCQSDSVALADAGACGACLYNAMSAPGGPCQQQLIKSDFGCETYVQNEITACATPAGSNTCITPDCSGLSKPDAGLEACLWQTCQGTCPNF